MKKRIIIEGIGLLGIFVLTGLITGWLFGYQNLDSGKIDLQFHDTFIVFLKRDFMYGLFTVLLIASLILRFILKLNNRIVLGVLSLIFLTTFLFEMLYLDWLKGFEVHIKAVYSRPVDKEILAKNLPGIQLVKDVTRIPVMMSLSFLTASIYRFVQVSRSKK